MNGNYELRMTNDESKTKQKNNCLCRSPLIRNSSFVIRNCLLALFLSVQCFISDAYAADTSVVRTQATRNLLSWLNRQNPKPALGGNWIGNCYENSLLQLDQLGWEKHKQILGKEPLVFGFEYFSTKYDTRHLQKRPPGEQQLARADAKNMIIDKARKGGIITITDHMPNFVTYELSSPGQEISKNKYRGTCDDTNGEVIYAILPGGDKHDEYKEYLDEMAEYFKSLTVDGEPIPILFRPFHEMNANWFWWGYPNSELFTENGETKREYVKLWRFTWNYLTHEKGLRNLIWVWNIAGNWGTDNVTNRYYPGSMYVDVVSVNAYILDDGDNTDTSYFSTGVFVNRYRDIEQIASKDGLPIAISEFGFNYFTKREPAVWLEKLPDFLSSKKPSYILIWSGGYDVLATSITSTQQDKIEDADNFRTFVFPAPGEQRVLLLGDLIQLYAYKGAVITFPVISKDGAQSTGMMIVPERTFSESAIIDVKQHGSLAPADSNVRELSHTNIGVIIDAQGKEPKREMELRIPYNNSDIMGMNEDSLVIARYDAEKQVWIPLKSTVDINNKQIIVSVNKLSVYAIMGTTNTVKVFENMKYYPNPIQPSKGLNYAKMNFSNIPVGTRIKIYTMLGQVVRDLEADASGMAVWDGKNNSGEKAASGVYIVYMEDGNGNKKRIKVAVER